MCILLSLELKSLNAIGLISRKFPQGKNGLEKNQLSLPKQQLDSQRSYLIFFFYSMIQTCYK